MRAADRRAGAIRFGTTFSEPYALSLGLEPGECLRALAGELGLRVVRLCTYWDRTEPEPGPFDFSSLDWQVDEAAGAGLEITLTVGQKAPRWPEFYVPSWTPRSAPAFEEQLLRFVEATVTHFRDAPVSVWQVENEPYISVGGPPIDEVLLRREIALVRSLDGRPIMVTESGGERDWRRAGRWCDNLGVNLYTRVWKRHWTNLFLGGYVDIATSAARYKERLREVGNRKSEIGKRTVPAGELRSTKHEAGGTRREVIVAELQAEPWGPRPVAELTPAEAAETMTPDRLRRNVQLADAAGFETALLWGGEWWYWLRERGDASMWQAVREVVEAG